MNINEIMEDCHLTVKHNNELFDIDEIAGKLLKRKIYDQNGSEFEVINIDGKNVTIKQYSYDITFKSGEYIETHVMKISGHIEEHEPDYPVFIPSKWEIL